jgi:hypothetical protein
MSTVTPPQTTWQWPADVQDFARRQRVDAYLNPLLEATRGVFPTARDVRVFLEGDPEIRDDWHIIFEVRVPRGDVPHSVRAQHFWIDELYRICPAPLVCVFRLALMLES